jgi:hypothetical protein
MTPFASLAGKIEYQAKPYGFLSSYDFHGVSIPWAARSSFSGPLKEITEN